MLSCIVNSLFSFTSKKEVISDDSSLVITPLPPRIIFLPLGIVIVLLISKFSISSSISSVELFINSCNCSFVIILSDIPFEFPFTSFLLKTILSSINCWFSASFSVFKSTLFFESSSFTTVSSSITKSFNGTFSSFCATTVSLKIFSSALTETGNTPSFTENIIVNAKIPIPTFLYILFLIFIIPFFCFLVTPQCIYTYPSKNNIHCENLGMRTQKASPYLLKGIVMLFTIISIYDCKPKKTILLVCLSVCLSVCPA